MSGDFARTLVIRVSQQYWAYTQALEREKLISPPFRGPKGLHNDWCINKWTVRQETLSYVFVTRSDTTGLYRHKRMLEARNFRLRKKSDCTRVGYRIVGSENIKS